MSHLDMLLTGSEPGASLHHLHVVAAPPDAIGPLGLTDEKRLHSTVYAIAADDPRRSGEPVGLFIAKAILTAKAEATRSGLMVLFAALSDEARTVKTTPGSPADDAARRLHEDGRLQEHPDRLEATFVYGACRDGRRWQGMRWLTGPQAGTSEGVSLIVGRPEWDEGLGMPGAALVRRLVGLTG